MKIFDFCIFFPTCKPVILPPSARPETPFDASFVLREVCKCMGISGIDRSTNLDYSHFLMIFVIFDDFRHPNSILCDCSSLTTP